MWDEPELYYDRQGRPIPWQEWVRLNTLKRAARSAGWTTPDLDPSRIGLTKVTEEITVSTVWMGLDHRIGEGPPLIFETMVFGGPDNEEMERYSTEAQALAGHDQWVARQRRLVGLERWWR